MQFVLHGGHSIFDPTPLDQLIGADTATAIFTANEDLDLFIDAGAPGTFDILAMFDGTREAFIGKTIKRIRLRQSDDGVSGNSKVEVYRNRGGAFPGRPIATRPCSYSQTPSVSGSEHRGSGGFEFPLLELAGQSHAGRKIGTRHVWNAEPGEKGRGPTSEAGRVGLRVTVFRPDRQDPRGWPPRLPELHDC